LIARLILCQVALGSKPDNSEKSKTNLVLISWIYDIKPYKKACHIVEGKPCDILIKIPATTDFLPLYEESDKNSVWIQINFFFINALGYKTEGTLQFKRGEEAVYKIKQFVDIR
jgi:hypothetical protein